MSIHVPAPTSVPADGRYEESAAGRLPEQRKGLAVRDDVPLLTYVHVGPVRLVPHLDVEETHASADAMLHEDPGAFCVGCSED